MDGDRILASMGPPVAKRKSKLTEAKRALDLTTCFFSFFGGGAVSPFLAAQKVIMDLCFCVFSFWVPIFCAPKGDHLLFLGPSTAPEKALMRKNKMGRSCLGHSTQGSEDSLRCYSSGGGGERHINTQRGWRPCLCRLGQLPFPGCYGYV